MPEREPNERAPEKQNIEFRDAMEIKNKLGAVVSNTGEDVLKFEGDIIDTGYFTSHETSTIDAHAKSRIEHYLGLYLPHIEGFRRFESQQYEITLFPSEDEQDQVKKYYFIIDEIDGTTNTKRAIASRRGYRPQASISIALSLTERLGDIQVTAVYDIARRETFTSIRNGNNFMACVGDSIINPKDVEPIRGDSDCRILVIGYSNIRRAEKAQIEEALMVKGSIERDRVARVYDGCRSSSIDILNVIRGQYDAYVDPRALWGKDTGSVLEAYDVAGTIPIALGSGLVVSDIHSKPWEDYGGRDAIPLVVARPAIYQKIIETIVPVVEQWQ